MASFPASLWARFAARLDSTPNLTNQAGDHNAMADEIVAIETELGLTPKSPYFADVAARLDSLERPPFNVVVAASYTLVLTDIGKLVSMVSGTAQTVVVPPHSSVAFPVGQVIQFRQGGAGQVTFSAGTGVTLRSRGSVFRTAGIYAYASIIQIATDIWDVYGDIVA